MDHATTPYQPHIMAQPGGASQSLGQRATVGEGGAILDGHPVVEMGGGLTTVAQKIHVPRKEAKSPNPSEGPFALEKMEENWWRIFSNVVKTLKKN